MPLRCCLRQPVVTGSPTDRAAWLLVRDGRSLDEAEGLIRRALEQNPEPRALYENTLQTILDAQ